ncbi:MAG: translation initiation factor IF-2 [Alphaproteobacteria bacterium]|nr:translation initiation factor IF-2 [Alphaproteobacteria bacterium]
MTDNDNNPKRSKLTLKLPTSSKAPSVNNTSNLNTKVLIDKKSSSSPVQVTIKGRKPSSQSKENKNSSELNKNELEARIKAISKSSPSPKSEKNIKTHEILSKINKENQLNEAPITNTKNDNNYDNSSKDSKGQISNDLNKNLKSETTLKLVDIKLDNFDVRNKIKQSLQIANQQKEEREKIIEERKKKEIEQNLEKEKIELEKKKIKKNSSFSQKNFAEDDSFKKPNIKESIKGQKFNPRKLTYIINSDDDSDEYSFSQRRKKSKNQVKIEEPKEYKKISREVNLPDLITVSELAERMSEKAGDVVKKLFSMGMVVTSNQAIDAETAEIIVSEFGHTSKKVSHSDVENILDENDSSIALLPRAPIVTIMGHVDHGKTSLLDALRETDIVSGEHGGITQHIGASRIQTKDHKFITFLDTPGHEAFTEMRSRGANVTDIVVLVVAADDGVKEQTVEAINHAKAANVPIIVAVNKIDKTNANPQIVKNELLNHQLVSEDLGGDIMFVPVSAKAKTNLDKLEEAILLQAEILELKAPYEGKSSGVVLESRVDPAKGVVATMLVQKGTLDTGDIVVVGTSYGKIRKMTDSSYKQLKFATPSMPVEILGLDSAPNAGDKFVEVDEERQAREIISYRIRKEKEEKALKNSARSISDIFKESGKGKLKYLNIIIKGDVHGSVEAIAGSIAKVSNEEVAIKIIHSATGGISESDVSLATASGAIIIGFNVRANLSAKELALLKGIEIRYYSIIYNLVDDLKLILSGLLNPTKNEEYLGQAEIRQIFKISNAGKVAGTFVIDGTIKRNARARLLRDNVVIHDGTLKTLKRFKDDVKEVKNGFECGIAFENFEDIKEKDVIECYEIVEQKRTIQ